MDILPTIEILVLVAIAIEVVSLYRHAMLENRMHELINNTNEHLIRFDEVIKLLDEHMTKFDEHLTRYDEHMNRFDDFVWKSYFQKINIDLEETTSR